MSRRTLNTCPWRLMIVAVLALGTASTARAQVPLLVKLHPFYHAYNTLKNTGSSEQAVAAGQESACRHCQNSARRRASTSTLDVNNFRLPRECGDERHQRELARMHPQIAHLIYRLQEKLRQYQEVQQRMRHSCKHPDRLRRVLHQLAEENELLRCCYQQTINSLSDRPQPAKHAESENWLNWAFGWTLPWLNYSLDHEIFQPLWFDPSSATP